MLSVLLSGAMTLGAFVSPAMAEPGDAQTGSQAAPQTGSPTGPQIGAPSALLMEASTGTVIFEKNADEPRNPA